VREEAAWIRAQGLEPRFYCGGAWYMDAEVAAAVADLGYTDTTATSRRPAYLPAGEPRIGLDRPGWLRLPDGRRLCELPTTHSLGSALRSRRLPQVVHVYFHDYDLLDRRRALALRVVLAVLARRRRPSDLVRLAATVADDGPEIPFEQAADR
jgi:hypothetical protein